jgi:soluble lytic murein transglycosylase-like protein
MEILMSPRFITTLSATIIAGALFISSANSAIFYSGPSQINSSAKVKPSVRQAKLQKSNQVKKQGLASRRKAQKTQQVQRLHKSDKAKTHDVAAHRKIAKTLHAHNADKGKKVALRRKSQKLQQARVLPANRQQVVALIKNMAPSYGVPTWFALKIAKVESGYNPRARGAAGEYGVFQMKCATARGIGFRGNCSALLNPKTNVQYGLKHLSLAVRSSRGNLRLAASKHNGGLGRKSLVQAYVRRVF